MDDKDARVAALEAELAAVDARYSRLAGWYGDECERRKAAEAVLQEYRIRLHAEECWEMSEIDAHLARYKD